MSEGKGGLKIKKPSFKAVIIILILALLCAAAFCVTRYDLLGNIGEGKKNWRERWAASLMKKSMWL